MTPFNNAIRHVSIAALLVLGAWPLSASADLYVIVNSSLRVSIDDIKAIYTGDTELIGSVKVQPSDNRGAQSEFLSKVLGLNVNRYDSLWTMKSFRDGLTPPTAKSTDAEVIEYVLSKPGAMGYVTTPPPSTVTVLKKY